MNSRRKPIPTTSWFRSRAATPAGARGGPYTPLRQPPDTRSWRPADGDLVLTDQDAIATLRIEASGLTLAGLLAAIRLDPGSALPSLGPAEIGLEGVRGSLVLHGATIRFAGLAALLLAEPRRPLVPMAGGTGLRAAARP